MRFSRYRRGKRSVPLDVAALIVLPILLLILNDSWTSGWVDIPPSGWVNPGAGWADPPTQWVNPGTGWIDTPIGWIDPFFYQGFFVDLKSNLLLHKQSYGGGSYYGSRLPWLLLGNAVYSIASPEMATIILRLLLFYGGTFSLYSIIRMLTGNDLASLIAALLLGVNTYFLGAIGWNYVDGLGIVVILLALAFLTKAATSEAWRMALCLSGVAAEVAVSVNIFLVTAMPSLLMWYLLINARRGKHRLDASVGLMALGGLVALGLFGLINQHLMGEFNYLLPQIAFAIRGHASEAGHLFSEAGWLVMPGWAAILSASFLGLFAYRRTLGRPLNEAEFFGFASAVAFLFLLGIFVYLDLFTSSAVLRFSYYANYLLPFAFLVIGAAICLTLSDISPPFLLRVGGAGIVILCLLAPFAVGQLRFMPGCPATCLTSERLQLLLAGAFGVMTIAQFRKSAGIGLAGLTILSLVNVGMADQRVFAFSDLQREAMHRKSLMVFDAATVVRRQNENGDIRFGIDLTDPFGWVYAGVAGQNLWNLRLVSLEFPKLRPNVQLTPGERIMLASQLGDDVILRANERLADEDMHLEVFERSRIQRGQDSFDIFFTTVVQGSLYPKNELH